VAFHDNFWLAASAAAPVIALAAVVILSDVSTVLNVYAEQIRVVRRRARMPDRLRLELADGIPGLPRLDLSGYTWGSVLMIRRGIVLNLIIQAGLLAVSLSALATSQDVMPMFVAIVLAVGGILLLAATTTAVVKVREEAARRSRSLSAER
jgi:hypothetical protein